MCARESEWVALSFDVACAHKRVRVRDSEQGFGCFALEDELFVYRCCYFGAKYSAYWWSRVGGWITRMLHRFVWVSHALFLYVDDGMLLLPKPVAPLLASACLAFLSALGVPLSWRKVQLGTEIVWILRPLEAFVRGQSSGPTQTCGTGHWNFDLVHNGSILAPALA